MQEAHPRAFWQHASNRKENTMRDTDNLPRQNWMHRAQLASATLQMFNAFHVRQMGMTARERWRNTYRMTRAEASHGNSLLQWATRHNPFNRTRNP